MEVLALIPARSGSKSLPDKNIRLVGGKPLLVWSIEHALAAKTVTRTILSTDSPRYAEIGRSHGAEIPFLRPAALAGDLSTDWEVFYHALSWLAATQNYHPEICVHLRPTHPVRHPADIDRMVEILRQDPRLDSVRSVVPAPETPYKMWFRADDGKLAPVIRSDIPEAYNQPRQALPPTYLQNASIDVVRSRVILEQHSMTGRHIHGYVMDASYDIDNELQLERARQQLAPASASLAAAATPKTFVFDIDGVIATLVASLDYRLAGPNQEIIQAINFLHAQGHRIILFTARGSATGRDWRETTRRQLNDWGVHYHDLLFGKPAADYYIDDKALPIGDALQLAHSWGLPS